VWLKSSSCVDGSVSGSGKIPTISGVCLMELAPPWDGPCHQKRAAPGVIALTRLTYVVIAVALNGSEA